LLLSNDRLLLTQVKRNVGIKMVNPTLFLQIQSITPIASALRQVLRMASKTQLRAEAVMMPTAMRLLRGIYLSQL